MNSGKWEEETSRETDLSVFMKTESERDIWADRGNVVDGTPVREREREPRPLKGYPGKKRTNQRRRPAKVPLCVGKTPNGWVPRWYESGQIGQSFFDAETRPPSHLPCRRRWGLSSMRSGCGWMLLIPRKYSIRTNHRHMEASETSGVVVVCCCFLTAAATEAQPAQC